jgi:membrane-associated PAP2 superfamily phosphatase
VFFPMLEDSGSFNQLLNTIDLFHDLVGDQSVDRMPCCTNAARRVAAVLFAVYSVIVLIIAIVRAYGGLVTRKKALIILVVVLIGAAVVGANVYFKRQTASASMWSAADARPRVAGVGVRQDATESQGRYLRQ